MSLTSVLIGASFAFLLFATFLLGLEGRDNEMNLTKAIEAISWVIGLLCALFALLVHAFS